MRNLDVHIYALVTESREDYASMSTGHAGLGGFCVAIAARMQRMLDKMEEQHRPKAQPQPEPQSQMRITEAQ
jgi:hypothetical protein